MAKKDKGKKKAAASKPRVIRKKKTGLKVKKKIWIPIYSDKFFDNAKLGSSPVVDSESLMGKSIKVNLSNLTRDLRNQNVLVGFKVNRTEEQKAFATPVSYSLSAASISKFVRKNVKRVDNSFICVTKDNVVLRVKPFAVTRFKTTSLKTRSLNNLLVDFVAAKVKSLTFSQLIEALMRKKFQEEGKRTLSKIYPLRIFEIRSLRLARGKEPERVVESTMKLDEAPVKEKPKVESEPVKPVVKKEEKAEVKEAVSDSKVTEPEKA